MPKPKHGKLKDIFVNEVSMVDLPANKLPMIFFKRKDAVQSQFVKAKKKIKIEIESNSLVGGTNVSVNGENLGKLRSFDFSFYGDDPKGQIHASYSKVAESEDGFSRTETYYLTKGTVMDAKTLKALQAYLGTDEIDFEKKVNEEDIEKALNCITKEYRESFPEDLVNAVGVIAKRAASSYNKTDKEVEKAGAKFSKDVLKKLQAVLAAVEALKSILPGEATEKADTSKETEELTKQIGELKETIAKLDPDNEDTEKSGIAELTKTLKEVSERVKAMEDGGATKKSITGDDDNEKKQKGAGEDNKVLWPSLVADDDDDS